MYKNPKSQTKTKNYGQYKRTKTTDDEEASWLKTSFSRTDLPGSEGSKIASISSQRSFKDETKISQGEIDDVILKESQKIIEFDDLPKGILKKLLDKINRQSFQDDPNTEIEINDAYSFEDIQTASISLCDKMRICNEVSPKTSLSKVSFCYHAQVKKLEQGCP